MPSAHDKYAKNYDNQLKEYNCYIADALFGLSYEYISKGETLLDIGIGTGESSILFAKAGLHIIGMDGSREMLKLCKNKKIAEELIEHDLLKSPWPMENRKFNHIICCGVFHFLGDLSKIFEEIYSIHLSGGILGFTIMDSETPLEDGKKYHHKKEGDFNIFSHNLCYIYNLLKTNQYTKEKEMVAYVGQTQFRVILTKKEKS